MCVCVSVLGAGELGGDWMQVFRGNRSEHDHFRVLLIEQSSLLVGARNLVYNISLETLTEINVSGRQNIITHIGVSAASFCLQWLTAAMLEVYYVAAAYKVVK